jgi:hypothetical protein
MQSSPSRTGVRVPALAAAACWRRSQDGIHEIRSHGAMGGRHGSPPTCGRPGPSEVDSTPHDAIPQSTPLTAQTIPSRLVAPMKVLLYQ